MPAPLNPNQLRMFMTARELVHDLQPGDTEGHASVGAMWESKIGESAMEGLDDDVVRQGVHVPVDIMHREGGLRPMLWDGHHRSISAYEADPDSLVPVLHEDKDSWSYDRSSVRRFPRSAPGWEE